MLGNNDLGSLFTIRGLSESDVVGTMNEYDHVGIQLDRT